MYDTLGRRVLFDAGCAQLIIDGDVGLLQYDQIDRFVENGALLTDGSVKEVDLIGRRIVVDWGADW